MGAAAIAIKRTSNETFHVGLLHRSEITGIQLLHLAWHRDLRNEFPSASYAWIGLNLDPYVQENIAARCRNVYATCGLATIPYSFAPGTRFASDYSLESSSGAVGFTCSTFVMRLLDDAGVRLLDESSWRLRPDDEAWQSYVLGALSCDPAADPRHLEYLRASIGVFRFTPLDVAAAAQMRKPATFDEIADLATSIGAAL